MNNEKTILLFFLLIINISYANFAFPLSNNTSQISLDSLRETIIALDVTRTKSKQTLKQLINFQNMSLKKDINEYTVFIEYLSYQIISYCQEINAEYGLQAISDLPCESHNGYYRGTKNKIRAKEVKTTEEQVSSLEHELMNSLGDFDEMLLKEDEHIAQVSRKQASSTNSSSKGKNSKVQSESTANKQETEDSQGNQGNGKEQVTQNGQQQSENNKQSNNSGTGRGKQKTTGKNQSRERRKLDEIDDDIVARQLKEAAEKETDPQLKEKLWDEYYRYKKKTLKR